ncbi:MAG: hypothetical protein LUC37_03865, partial [Prevotella sp.]|nr:hypothetical protein [Prevotella sp.]
ASDTSLINFMQEHSNQRINIYIKDSKEFLDKSSNIELFEACREEHPELNFIFKLNRVEESKDLILLLKEKNFKFFFNYYISDWDTLHGVFKLEPTDVYIVEELGFELKTVAEQAHARKTNVRVFPNVAQSAWKATTGLMKFFIRPEDTSTYEDFVDTMELFGEDDKLSTYYKIYAKDKKWFGNLNEMIIDLKLDIDSRCLLPNFSYRRLNCGRRCLKGRKCWICAVTHQLSQVLSENNLTISQLSKKQTKKVEKSNNPNIEEVDF